VRIPRLFVDQDLAPDLEIDLEEASSHYLRQVLRCKSGQQVTLFNGRGGEYSAELKSAGKRTCRIRLFDFNSSDRESPLKITLGLALSKGDRFDWALQKSTELGVHCIQPLLTERNELRLSPERLAKKVEHWKRLIVSSCEQCQRNILPIFETPVTLEDWFSKDRHGPAFILQPGASADDLTGQNDDVEQVSLAVGPEGGFSQAEVELALSKGFIGMPLGPRILRTETAPMAAMSILQWRWGDLSA